MHKRGPLTPAELRQRQEAAKASARHRAETSPSIRQGSSGPPSRQAIGLFAQGKQRPDTRARRGVFDTRTSEPTVGRINATVTFHHPTAYHDAEPEAKPKGRPLLAETLGEEPRKKGRGRLLTENEVRRRGGLIIKNPGAITEAHRHPTMRAIVQHVVGVVREHQKPTIERAHERKLIPEGTHPSALVTAYRHAAFHAMHKAGIIDYQHEPMDEHTKAALKPLNRFMFYAHRRVFDHLNQGELAHKWEPFRREFGELYRQKKHGKLTGVERYRMRSHGDRFIKLEGDLGEILEKAATFHLHGLGQAIAHMERAIDRPSVRLGLGGAGLGLGIASYHRNRGAAPALPPIGHPSLHVKHRARTVEAHYGVPPIGGMTTAMPNGVYQMAHPVAHTGAPVAPRSPSIAHRSHSVAADPAQPNPKPGLQRQPGKLSKSTTEFFLLGTNPDLGNYNTDPARQLRRAMHPRLRRRFPRLRLNTQRHLRRLLSGGITRQERWQLGASTQVPAFKAEKLTKPQVRYTPDGSRSEHCSICRNYLAPDHCRRVIGTVVPGGWCTQWAALQKSFASNVAQGVGNVIRHHPAKAAAIGGTAALGFAPMHNHPKVRAIARAAAAGSAMALLSHGAALRSARVAGQRIFREGLKDAVRQHARVLAGGTPSPHQQAAARRAFVAAAAVARHAGEAHRQARIAGYKLPKARIAGAAAIGGIYGLNHPRLKMPSARELNERFDDQSV